MAKYRKGRFSRFLKLSGLTTKVGASYLGQKIKGAFVSDQTKDASLLRANVRNADRIVKTLGELKGTVMKLGQMMSLQADVLPREMTEILAKLQKEAPPVAFEVIQQQVERELEAPLSEVFAEFDEQAYASASIGQVHRALLPDGREVVVKVQYPDVDKVVDSDLKNVRTLFSVAAQVKSIKNMDAVFEEVRARMTEEVDYCNERLNILHFTDLFADDPRVVIPKVVDEHSTRRVLTMEIVRGATADDLCLDEVPQQRRDRIAATLVDLVMKQVFELGHLHADPNLANFAFTDDDRVIFYDFGCVKRFPPEFITAYKKVVVDALANRLNLMSDDLAQLGFADTSGKPIELELLQDYAAALITPWSVDSDYCFGTSEIHSQLMELGLKHWTKFSGFVVPSDIIFLNRVIGGMYGTMRRFNATANWGRMLRAYL